jgi:hypothetical protein
MKKSKMASLAPIFYALVTLHLALVTVCAQPSANGGITWQRVYDGPSQRQDFARDICASTDGNYYIVGTTRYPFYYAIYVLKINDNGDTLWTRIIGGWTFGGQLAYAVAPSSDGGCVLTGDADTAFTMKFGASGNLVWYKRYGGRYVRCLDITQTLDGGYIACGFLNNPNINGYILRIDSLGNLQWQRIYHSSYLKSLKSILQMPNGGFLTVGVTYDYIEDTTRSLVMKLDDTGNVQWEKRFFVLKGSSADVLCRISTGYLIGGTTADTTTLANDLAYFARIDSNGDLKYTKIFPSFRNELLTDTKVIGNNRFIITTIRDTSNFIDYARAMVVDSLGDIVHSKTNFSNGTYEIFHSVLPLTNGDIILTGGTDYFDYDEDLYIVRTDSALNTTTIGIEILGGTLPTHVTLLQNFPNPFNATTIIKFEISENTHVELAIFDISGRKIQVLINQEVNAGPHQVSWDGTNFASGIYFYRLIAADYTETKKMVLTK